METTQEKAASSNLITQEEYDEIKEAISEFALWQQDCFPEHLKKCFRYAASMIPYHNSGEPIDDIMNDTLDETLLIDLVEVIAKIRKRHNTYVDLPKYETLTRKPEKGDLTDLSPSEVEDIKRWRDINRVRDLLGGVKEMKQHRRNLKEAFAGTEDPEARKTWEALDAKLKSDIRFAESLTAVD